MTHMSQTTLTTSAERFLLALARRATSKTNAGQKASCDPTDITCLLAADLIARREDGSFEVGPVGQAYLARRGAVRSGSALDPFLAQHLYPDSGVAELPQGHVQVRVNEAESPLVWLARRKGRDGQPLIACDQLQAGERLRAEFTRAQLTPRITSNWDAATAQSARGDGVTAAALTDAVIGARQRVRHALDAVGPEFAGLLLDVCCFLKGLEDVERERRWPPRSAKVVLQLGLDRLARHYGFSREARGRAASGVRVWLAPDAKFMADGA